MKIRIELISDDNTIYFGEVLLQKGKAQTKRPVVKPIASAQQRKCPAVIARLWQHGDFKRALSVAEVKKALDAAEYSFPDSTILMALSRAKFLTRHGSKGAFSWKQKYPFR
jgi:hypothetical protein